MLRTPTTNAYTSTAMEHRWAKRDLEGYLWMSSYNLLRLQHDPKVNSFYLRTHAIIFMNWLLFECCFAFVVSFVGYMESEGTLKSYQVNLLEDNYVANPKYKNVSRPPLHRDECIESRTLFEGGELMRPDLRSQPHLPLRHTPCRHGLQR